MYYAHTQSTYCPFHRTIVDKTIVLRSLKVNKDIYDYTSNKKFVSLVRTIIVDKYKILRTADDPSFFSALLIIDITSSCRSQITAILCDML